MKAREENAHRKWLINAFGERERNRKQRHREPWLREKLSERVRNSPEEFDAEDIHTMIGYIDDKQTEEMTKRSMLMYMEWLAEDNPSAFNGEHVERIHEIKKEKLHTDLQKRLIKLLEVLNGKKE